MRSGVRISYEIANKMIELSNKAFREHREGDEYVVRVAMITADAIIAHKNDTKDSEDIATWFVNALTHHPEIFIAESIYSKDKTILDNYVQAILDLSSTHDYHAEHHARYLYMSRACIIIASTNPDVTSMIENPIYAKLFSMVSDKSVGDYIIEHMSSKE